MTKLAFGWGHDKCNHCKIKKQPSKRGVPVISGTEKPLTYAFGDIVKIIKTGEKGIINAAKYDYNPTLYCVNGPTFYLYEDLEFVKRATKKSLAVAFKNLQSYLNPV